MGKLNGPKSPVIIDVKKEQSNMTVQHDFGNSSTEEATPVVSEEDLRHMSVAPSELAPDDNKTPYFEQQDGQGRTKRFLERRRNRSQQTFQGYVEITIGDDRTHIPLTSEERVKFLERTEKMQNKVIRNVGMTFWSQLAGTVISIIGAAGLGYAMYRGIKHDATKDTKMP